MNTLALRERERLSFDKQFYTVLQTGKRQGTIYGFPMRRGQWCTSFLKVGIFGKRNIRENVLSDTTKEDRQREVSRNGSGVSSSKKPLVRKTKGELFSDSSLERGADINIVQYLGIAADEPERIERHTKPGYVLPLVDIGWDEAYCRKWCEENDLLSPIYTTAARGGCWFCHNQGIDQLRLLRQNYPDLWSLLMKWDKDSPVTFHADGRTVHDFEQRFSMEELGLIPCDRSFRWNMLTTRQSEWLDELLKDEE